MSADTRTVRFPERTMRQIRLDAQRATMRARFCPDRSEATNLRCVDYRRESDLSFGSQLWYFDGIGIDDLDRRLPIYGVIEYSIQFGLHELVEDRVLESDGQRERFHSVYEREQLGPTWRGPAHRWLAAGLLMVSVMATGYFLKSLAW